MNSYSFQETRKNPQTARKVTFHLSFFSPVTHDAQDGSLSSYLSNDSKSKSVYNQRKEDKMDVTPSSAALCSTIQRVRSSAIWPRNPSISRAWLKEHLTPMSLAATRCRMLPIASMQWILSTELLRRCKKLANLNSLYFTGPNQRVTKATTSILYKHGGSRIQTAWLWGRQQQRMWDLSVP